MGKINVLDKFVAELIAAGEVIERPASVVKELVENSIDAGATNITVEIKNGGLKYIRVTDNGSGILREDVRNAFLRNATSKVKTAEDLNDITTLGFRGEALASIAAMCKVEMLTGTENSIEGTRYEICGGDEQFFGAAGCPKGTTIIVRDIFYNTPARMKFLKKDITEGNMVASVIDKIALSHPEVSIKFIRDSQIKLQTSGNSDLLSCIYSVLGKQFADGLVKVQYEYNGVKVFGYTCKSEYAKPNRTFQNIYINTRYVKSKTCVAALDEAYKHNIMVGKFPYCVLDIKVSPNDVDVNVHPSKIEVRFFNEKQIFDAVYYACKNALEAVKAHSPEISQIKRQPVSPFLINQQPVMPVQQHFSPDEYKSLIKIEPEIKSQNSYFSFEKKEPVYFASDKKHSCNYSGNYINNVSLQQNNQAASTLLAEKEAIIPKNEDEKLSAKPPAIKNEGFESLKIIGELFNTYIVLQNANSMLLVDKHAAHERIIFEKLKENSAENKQMLLSPVAVTLSKEDYSALIDSKAEVNSLGFEIDDFGDGTIIVRSAPMYLDSSEIANAVIEISDKLKKNKKNITTDFFDDLLHSVACRAAIKANDKSSICEIEALVKMLANNSSITHCPHGRPIFVEFSKYEIEKLFGRLG